MERWLFAYTFYFMHCIFDFAPTTPNLSGLKQRRSCMPCSQLVQVGVASRTGAWKSWGQDGCTNISSGQCCCGWVMRLPGAGLSHASLPGSVHFTAIMGALGVRGQTQCTSTS